MKHLKNFTVVGSFLMLVAMMATAAFGHDGHAAAGFSGAGLLSFIVYLVIIGLIFWCVWWFVAYVGVPEPFNKVIRVVLGLIALIIVVNMLLGLLGTPMFRLG